MRFGHTLHGSLFHAVCPHGRHIHRCGQGTPRLVGAHIGTGLFPADMLFPGLERKDKRPLTPAVRCLPHNASGQLPCHGGCGRHESKIGTAERKGHSKGLSVPHCNVSAIFSRRLHHCQSHGITGHDIFGSGFMGNTPQTFPVLQVAVIVWLLHVEAGCLGICLYHILQGLCVRDPVLFRYNDHSGIAAKTICLDHFDRSRTGCGGNIRSAPLPVPAHGHSLPRRGGAIIHRCIGSIHSCQLTDHGLIFKYGLQDPLADLRLVRRVCCYKLLLGDHAGDNGGYVMIVGPRSPENMPEHHILFRHLLHPGHYRLLIEAGGDLNAVL